MISIIVFILSFNSYAFIIVDKDFRLKDPEKVKVKISSEACSGNGIEDGELSNAIKKSIEYWNNIPESSLKLKFAGHSTVSATSSTIPSSEIIIGCAPLSGVSGVANLDKENGSGRVRLNSNELTPGSYTFNGLVGLIMHEMGHVLGLGHSGDPSSVMTYEPNGWGAVPKYTSQDDIDGVVYLYPNEKQLAGLLGSCESLASDGEYLSSNFDFLINLIIGISLVFGIRSILRRFKSFKIF